MKKSSFILITALAIAFITVQSFYYPPAPKPVIGKVPTNSPRRSVAVCGAPRYQEQDSAISIPALKGWGNYQWHISTSSDSVQYYFNQGISLYYAFHSLEAIASFTKATRLDPTCAMAWYGKALAMGPTINYDLAYLAPSAALEAAVKSKQLSMNCSLLEKDLINAIQQRYSVDTTINVTKLRVNYAEAMKLVYARHKNNADAITLYADAMLLLHPWDMYEHNFKPKPWTPQIRSLLEAAISISPKHPGANHYYIHTMEGSARPEIALKSAHLLDTLMPKVAHITHMPSHIYIRTGDYQRGIQVNDNAVTGYGQYLKNYSPVINGLFLYEIHSLHLQSNCAQMAGNYKTAVNAASKVQQDVAKTGVPAIKSALGNYMQYVYSAPVLTYVRFGKWDDILKISRIDTLPFADALLHFARGIAYSRKHQIPLAQKELKIFKVKMANSTFRQEAVTYSTAYDICKVADLILTGVIAEEQNDYTTAVHSLQLAVIAEDNLIYSEPRAWPIPARQYLGEVFIKAGKLDKAVIIFNKDLEINPNNGWSLTGLTIAFQSLNNEYALKQTKQNLKKAWKIKDIAINSPVF